MLASKSVKFNTFSGVFLPAVLAIFGAVIFYVAPRVLGGVGLFKMIIIIILAHSITLASSFSISTIATNIYVKGGGLYYLISRSLGSELGGSMGIQLFLAQTISVSFYSIAFAKAVSWILSSFYIFVPELYIALASFFVFWVIAFKGADFVIKLQYLILFAIIISFITIFMGANRVPTATEFIGMGGIPLTFWIAFTMFFPAVTGIDAGVGMSGDLKNPRKSLVYGSICAVIVTMLVYIAIIVKYFYGASLMELSSDIYIVQKLAIIPIFVIAGVLLTTSSSALSYLMAAPRTLRALAVDRIFSKNFSFLGKTIGKSSEPRIAMVITLIIGILTIMSGDLFFVSQIVAIFFLNVYGWINGAALLEQLSRNPSFRPSFKSHPLISFYGMIACYFVMFMFNPWIMIISIIVQFTIFFVLLKTKTSSKLESVWHGTLFQLFRYVLQNIEEADKSKKNWRPTIVAFSINRFNTSLMAKMLDWISATRGISKLYYLVTQQGKKNEKKREEIELDLKNYIKEYELELYPRVIVCNNYTECIQTVTQSEKLGNLPLNTLFIEYDEKLKIDEIVKYTIKLGKNVIVLRNKSGVSDFRKIDIWWDSNSNGNMMLLLAYLITHSGGWKDEGATIRIFKVVKTKKEKDSSRESLTRIIENSRIDNITVEILLERKKKKRNIIIDQSHNSDLVMLGFDLKKCNGKKHKSIAGEIKSNTDDLKASLTVFATEQIDLKIN